MVTSTLNTAADVEYVGVSKIYGGAVAAIQSLDLKIRPGEFLTLLGPSGSGKTTALNLLAGFESPSSGKILVDGKDISNLPAHKRNMGVVFQHYALFPHMTVRENIAYPLLQRDVPRADIEQKVSEAIQMVSLKELVDRMPRQLSGGQQQRVAVARAIVFRPRLLLMDEPLGALDRKLRESVQLELKRIHRELGVTILFVTHDQEEALVMSDRIAIFESGHVRQIGTAQDLYDAPDSQFVAQFLGDSNCFVGEVKMAKDACWISSVDGNFAGVATAGAPSTGSAAAVVRPERCRLIPSEKVPTGWNAVRGKIRDIVYLGSARKILIDLESGRTAVVLCQPDEKIPENSAITMGFPAAATRVVTARL